MNIDLQICNFVLEGIVSQKHNKMINVTFKVLVKDSHAGHDGNEIQEEHNKYNSNPIGLILIVNIPRCVFT